MPGGFISAILTISPPGESAFSFLVDLATYPAWIFYGLTLLGLIIYRYQEPKIRRPFKVWLIFPIIVIIVSAFLTIFPFLSTDMSSWLPSTISLTLMLIGIPVYMKLRKSFRIQLFN